MTKEQWKEVIGYEKLYQVSNLGRVKRISGGQGAKAGRILKPGKHSQGYLTVWLYKNGKSKCHLIHRIVLEAFAGKSNLGCNHINGKKDYNRLENLEYVTQSENVRHAFKIGLSSHKGEKNCRSKFTGSQVVRLRFIAKNYKPNRGYWAKLSRAFNVSPTTISDIINNKSWNHI